MKQLLAFITIFAALTAYGNTTPTINEARKVLEDSYKKDNCVKVVDLEKVNGQLQDVFGKKIYGMDISFKVELIAKCFGHYDKTKEMFTYGVGAKQWSSNPMRATETLASPLQIGEKYAIKSKIIFEQKENGWIGKRKYGF